ncbi:hypothetical protein T12_15006 [Trichinella patagoniensis]|uniref:Uncharacterized protein n=1 Tax=Trichinella patagoniensis TaxID=990121 RepID=A0A0V0ZT28_9BILA|nr:hypothetical protein T12_12952 [Trichinella patagoniensis]KRY15289.1 hypothetical protein T12_15006 [Trichinella patagoniensis]
MQIKNLCTVTCFATFITNQFYSNAIPQKQSSAYHHNILKNSRDSQLRDSQNRCKCIKFSCFAHNLDSVCQFKNCYSLVKFSECIDQRMYHQKIANQKYFQNKSQMKKKLKKFICIKLLLHAIITDFSNMNEQAGKTAFD